MKKIALVTLAMVVCAGLALAQAGTVTGTVAVTANVTAVWNLQLDLNAVTFNVEGGGAAVANVVVATVFNNYNSNWALWLTKDQDLTMGAEIIPSADFTFAGVGGAGFGTWTPGEFPMAGTDAGYERTSQFKVKNGEALTTTLTLDVADPDQSAGTYTNTITYTLTGTP